METVSTTPVAVPVVAPPPAAAPIPVEVTTTPVAPATPTAPAAPAEAPKPQVFGSYLEKAQADVQNAYAKFQQQQQQQQQQTGSGTEQPVNPTTPVSTTPGAPPIPASTTAPIDDIDNFNLDLDADHTATKPTVEPAAGDPTLATGAATSTPGDTNKIEKPESEEALLQFTPEQQAIIKQYLQTPTSQRFREQAKIIREISKPIDKGGLGRTPTPQEIINATQLAEGFRSLMDDYTSGDPNATNNWARHWLFQLGRSADGRIAPTIDPVTNLPVIRPGSVQATEAVVRNAALHPETATTAAETIYKAISEAHNNGAPWAADAVSRIGAPVIHGLVNQMESLIPNHQNSYLTMKDVNGKEVQIPGVDFIKATQNWIKETAGLTDPNTTPDDPEKAAMRQRLAAYEKSRQTTTQQQQQQLVINANQSFKNFFLQNLSTDVKLRLDPLAKVVATTNDPAAQADFDLTTEALANKMLKVVQSSPVFARQHTQYLRDIRTGVPVEEARKPLMRTARELYSEALKEEGKQILRSRLGLGNAARPGQAVSSNGTIQAQSSPQPQPTSNQSAGGTTNPVNPIPAGNPNPAGRPVLAIPQSGNGNVPTANHILPGESIVDYHKRQLMLRLGGGGNFNG